MKERMIAAGVISAAIIIAATIVASAYPGDAKLGEAVGGIKTELSALTSVASATRWETAGLNGSAEKIIVRYTTGEPEPMWRTEGFYVQVEKDHVVIHKPVKGEAVNDAKDRLIIPFSAIRSIERIAPNNH